MIGTFLPDIAAKGIYWVFQTRETFAHATHSLLGVVLISYLACLFVEDSIRRPGFFLLAAGGVIHVLVDLIKDNLGAGSARLFLPFSTRGLEFGWIDPENVVFLVPMDAAILGAAWLLERRFARVQQ